MQEYKIQIDDELATKLQIALQLSGESEQVVFERMIRQYLAKTFNAAANSLRDADSMDDNPQAQSQRRTARRAVPPNGARNVGSNSNSTRATYEQRTHRKPPQEEPDSPFDEWKREWGKAINRIPRWAKNPQQYNHKILRAFFELQQELGRVTVDALRNRCSDPSGHPKTYVPHFDNNFAQMKFDNGNSHGKVFEENNGIITLWDRINDTLMHYRDYFTT